MSIRREKKIRKMRGSRTHGWGIQGQHRRSGRKGGRGKAGRKSGKHKWSWVLKYQPDYFGKHGFHPIPKGIARTINVGELDELVEILVNKGLAIKSEKGIEIDLTKLGINKMLGSGKVTKPLIIKGVEDASKLAEEKIIAAGGTIIKE
ncbi:MAG: uL15 family ribosomal protein [Thermoprotei archaeon]